MNLRQKAKYYKKRCEMLEKLILPRRNSLDYIEQPIVTLYSEQRLQTEEYADMRVTDDMLLNKINANIARDFINQLLNYAQIKVQRDERLDCITIKARMKVVNMRKELYEV